MKGVQKTGSRNSSLQLDIEVLQNGQLISEASRRIGSKKKITLGSSSGNLLHIPFFPLASSIPLFFTGRKKAYLKLDESWQGYIFKAGKLVKLGSRSHKTRMIGIEQGDYGCFFLGDLQIIYRLRAKTLRQSVKNQLSTEYSSRFWDSIFSSKFEVIGAAVGLILSLLLSSSILMVVESGTRSPRHFGELSKNFLLPFIYPNHLATSPEALGKNLKASDFLGSVYRFYISYVEMLMGWKETKPELLYPQTIERYHQSHQIYKEKVDQTLENQKKIEESLKSKEWTSDLRIPVVIGETAFAKVERSIDKIEKLHDYLEKNIADKKEINESFAKEAGYQFTEYRNIKDEKPALNNIQIFELLTDEQILYKKSLELAQEAAYLQRHQTRRSSGMVISQINFPLNSSFANYLPPETLSQGEEKIDLIAASTYGQKVEKIKEPVIGKINKELLERVIDQNQYGLQVCYELSLRKNKNTAAKMVWSWVIDSQGQARDLRAESDSGENIALRECVGKKISSWTFPRPDRGSVRVSFPFSFQRNKG